MKTKAFVVGLIMFLAFSFNVHGQEKTFLEESGEAQDSAIMNDMLSYGLEEEKGPSTGLIIGIVVVVVAGGAVFFLMKKKKKQ